jgi:hypothetical protein
VVRVEGVRLVVEEAVPTEGAMAGHDVRGGGST